MWLRGNDFATAGQYVCFGIVPDGYDVAVGIFQIQIPPGEPAEWGFAMGSRFWGTGLFVAAAEAVLEFAFHGMDLDRVAARAAVDNGRGNGALRKLGATREELIPNGVVRNGRLLDQYYWTLSADDLCDRAAARKCLTRLTYVCVGAASQNRSSVNF